MSEALLAVRGLHTYYGDSYVLQGVDLEVREGTIAAILGRNGMGKTTLIRSVAGLTPPRTGDVLFQGSIGRTDFPRGNHQQLIDSITQRLWPLGNDMAFVPGHGPMSTFGRERMTNGYVADEALTMTAELQQGQPKPRQYS